MPSIITHAAVPLALYVAAERGRISPRLLAAGVVASMLPDIDVVSTLMGVPFGVPFGHRGATHSLLFALLVTAVGALFAGRLRSNPWQVAAWLFTCAISHPVLDAMTTARYGVMIGWPWSDVLWLAPWRPILVSPVGTGFFSARGVAVLVSEIHWVWLPLAAAVALWKLINRTTR